MRITGGRVKGRRLATLKGLNIRPSSDRVREAIFSLIGQDLTDLAVLDLFAGTGSLGIEALSRGASYVLFLDNAPQALSLIGKNLKLCGYESLGSVLKRDLTRGLPRRSSLMKRGFDLVFIDPPYGKELVRPLLVELDQGHILSGPSLVVTESSKADRLPITLGKLRQVKARTYGTTNISIFGYGE
jgi:16S rRNA (guanine966-N2)-methyltransferase